MLSQRRDGVLCMLPHTRSFRQEVCKRVSGGGDLWLVSDRHSVDVLNSQEEVCHKVGSIQTPEPLFGDQQHLPDDGRGVLDAFEAFGGGGPEPQRGERRLDGIGRPQMPPVFLGEAVEGDHPLPVLVVDGGRNGHLVDYAGIQTHWSSWRSGV